MERLTSQDFAEALRRMQTIFETKVDHLSELDSAIGDGDHGVSMTRGFRSVGAKLPSVVEKDIGAMASMVGMTLAGVIGGATGPIFGTIFLKFGSEAREKYELSVTDLAEGFRAAVEGVKAIGKAEVGDKTVVDALAPVAKTLEDAASKGLAMGDALGAAAAAAEEGARGTAELKATKGRGRYLGERSIGHQDPGAVSCSLIMRALAEAYASRHQGSTQEAGQ